MSVEKFRKDVAKTEPQDLGAKIQTYVYELNLLLRLARTYSVSVYVDTVERDGYTEIVIHDSH